MRRIIDFIRFEIFNNNTIESIVSSKFFKPILITIIILIFVVIGFFISEKNYFYGMLFYPDRTNTKLIYEKRAILKGKNRKERLDNIVSELLLGPLSPKIKNYFNKESKLLNSWLEKNVYYINLTEETIMSIESEDSKLYHLILQSIVNSICINDRKIENVKFYFNNKEYNYIANIKIKDGLKPDWKILLK